MSNPTDDLTDRQRDVLRLHTEGKNPTEIGKALDITSQAVHGHFRRLREKGLIAGDVGPKPAARKPRGEAGLVRGGTNATITPETAIRAAIELIEAQQAGLRDRLEEIGEERAALKLEEQGIHDALETLESMRPAQVEPPSPEPKPAAKAKAKAAAKPEPEPATA